MNAWRVLSVYVLVFNNLAFAGTINQVKIYKAPKGEILSHAYKVSVNKQNIPVYIAKIGAANDVQRFNAVDDLLNSADYYDNAGFAYFDMQGEAMIVVGINNTIRSVKILPESKNIKAYIHGHTVSFLITQPENLTIELNGEIVKSLHLFVNPIEKNIPQPGDPNVMYFGPGVHKISNLIIGDNKTLYVAGGAVLEAIIGKDEKFGVEPSGLKNYLPRILLSGNHIRICGHGIIDAGKAPVHAGNFIMLKGEDITIEGVIIRNSCGWTVPLRQCSNVLIDNIKILGYRANSDGIDVCNSKNVVIENCFIRTNDDLIVIKTFEHEGVANNIIIKRCTLWNELAHALSLGAELRENVTNVSFTDCDIIHDRGREWALRIFHSDSAKIKNIIFKKIRVAETHNLISLWIGKMASTLEHNNGLIESVLFSDITASGNPVNIVLTAATQGSQINGVIFKRVMLNKIPLKQSSIILNGVVTNVSVSN